MRATHIIYTLLFTFLIFWLAGCNDQTPPPAPMTESRNAQMCVTIAWPQESAATRLIPAATTMVTVTVTDAGGFINAQSATRPSGGITSVFVFEALPVGEVTVTATADAPAPDGPMRPVAKVTSTQTLHTGTNNAYLSMVTTVTSLDITAPSTTVVAGESLQLGVEARNAAGELVKIAPGALRWTSSATANANVNSNGLLTGIMPGTQVTITLRDTESTLTDQVVISVVASGG